MTNLPQSDQPATPKPPHQPPRRPRMPHRAATPSVGPLPRPPLPLILLAPILLLSCTMLPAPAQPPASTSQPASQPTTQPTAQNETAPAPTTQPETPTEGNFDDSGDVELLDLDIPIVVTATRRPQPLNVVPNAMSIITAEDIRRSGARSVPDALRLVPGVDVAELSFTQSAVAPRSGAALTANRILVLVDGRQIFDAYFGGTLWSAWPLQLDDIERIEVIRGPGGVTWGANALSGVINIITKDPADQLGVHYHALGGSYGWWKNHLSVGVKDQNLRLRISGEYEASDGFQRGGSLLSDLQDNQRLGRINIHGIYDHNKNETLTFSMGNALLNDGFSPTPLGTIIGGQRSAGAQASFLLGKYRHEDSPDNVLEITTYLNDFQTSTGLDAIDYRYQQLAFQLTHTFKPHPQHTITWGVDTRIDRVDASGCDPHGLRKPYVHSGTAGIYLQDTWNFAPRWRLDLGGRIDYDSYGGFEPSARAALSYALTDNAILYGAVSRSFAMPPAAARFLQTPLVGGLFYTTADQGVRAQSVIAYELGHRGSIANKLEYNVALYWHQCFDLASLPIGLGPPGLFQARFSNVGDANYYGVELEATYSVNEQLRLLGNYTYQQLMWPNSVPFQWADRISPPTHKAMLGLRYSPTEDLHLDSHLYYVDNVRAPDEILPFATRKVPALLRLDLRAEIEFWDDQAALSFGVKNLLDNHHPEGGSLFLNNAEVPRMVFAELRVNF